MFSDMPALVDDDHNRPFYPPPLGAADGGQPGFFGVRGNATPYPTFQLPLSPWQSPSDQPPNGAQSWTYGQYVASGTPTWPPPQQQPSSWGSTPASPWGPTPAGTWGAQSPVLPYGPTTPSGYPGFAGYGPQPQTPYFGSNPPGTPYDPSTWQPTTPGWVRADNGQQKKKKRKKTSSFGEHTWGDQTLRRSNSLGARVPLQRSASWGYPSAYGQGTPAYSREPYNSLNLARRPRDWRTDYTPREGIAALASYFPRMGRNKSDVQELSDPVRRNLHPLLTWDPQSPPIYYDLRDPFMPENIEFLNLNRPHNTIDLAQLVFQPTSDFLRISHPRLPWYIDIRRKQPNGVTIYDVFEQMHEQLHEQIQDKHFYNEDLNEVDRTQLAFTFNSRVVGNQMLHAGGILKVDFLGDKCVFEGLVRGPRGIWELRTTRLHPLA